MSTKIVSYCSEYNNTSRQLYTRTLRLRNSRLKIKGSKSKSPVLEDKSNQISIDKPYTMNHKSSITGMPMKLLQSPRLKRKYWNYRNRTSNLFNRIKNYPKPYKIHNKCKINIQIKIIPESKSYKKLTNLINKKYNNYKTFTNNKLNYNPITKMSTQIYQKYAQPILATQQILINQIIWTILK